MHLLQSGMMNYGFLHKLLYICMVFQIANVCCVFQNVIERHDNYSQGSCDVCKIQQEL